MKVNGIGGAIGGGGAAAAADIFGGGGFQFWPRNTPSPPANVASPAAPINSSRGSRRAIMTSAAALSFLSARARGASAGVDADEEPAAPPRITASATSDDGVRSPNKTNPAAPANASAIAI